MRVAVPTPQLLLLLKMLLEAAEEPPRREVLAGEGRTKWRARVAWGRRGRELKEGEIIAWAIVRRVGDLCRTPGESAVLYIDDVPLVKSTLFPKLPTSTDQL